MGESMTPRSAAFCPPTHPARRRETDKLQAPDNLQSWNRYSYVINNPLSLTDPSGFFFSGLFRAIGNFLSSAFRAIGNVVKVVLSNPIVRALLQIVACAPGPWVIATCTAAIAVNTFASGGSLKDGLKAVAFAFATMGIFDAVGGFLDGARAALGGAFGVVKAGVHGVIGGALSVAQGGSFLQGFASNAIGAVAGLASESVFGAARTGGLEGKLARTLVAAAAGCAGAIVTGGKCGQGAVTAAFAQLYNAEGGLNDEAKASKAYGEAELRKYLGDAERRGLMVQEQVRGQFLVDGTWRTLVADAVVVDPISKSVEVIEAKGGQQSKYGTEGQRAYIRSGATNAIFDVAGRVGNFFGGNYVVGESGFRLNEPTVITEEGSRISRSRDTQRLIRRGGSVLVVPVR